MCFMLLYVAVGANAFFRNALKENKRKENQKSSSFLSAVTAMSHHTGCCAKCGLPKTVFRGLFVCCVHGSCGYHQAKEEVRRRLLRAANGILCHCDSSKLLYESREGV